MKIAVIDGGIDKRLLSRSHLLNDMIVGQEGSVYARTTETVTTEHGTICAKIIEKYADEPPEFYSLSVFDNEEMTTSCDVLVSALRWCHVHKVPLVHMSIGSRCAADFGKITAEINKLIAAGQIVVAAISNVGQYTVPAQLGGVIGVMADERLTGFKWRIDGNPYVHASSRHYLDIRTEATQLANSYAAPTVTAAVSNLLYKNDRVWTVPALWYALSGQKYKYKPVCPSFLCGDNVVYAGKVQTAVHTAVSYAKQNLERQLCLLDEKLPVHCGIVCAGRLPESCEALRARRLIWDEGCLLPVQKMPPVSEEEACPVVFVTESHALKTAEKLLELLWEEGYSAIGISSINCAYLHRMLYISETENVRDKINEVCHTYMADIIVCSGHIGDDKITADDYVIHAEKDICAEKTVEDIVAYFS